MDELLTMTIFLLYLKIHTEKSHSKLKDFEIFGNSTIKKILYIITVW